MAEDCNSVKDCEKLNLETNTEKGCDTNGGAKDNESGLSKRAKKKLLRRQQWLNSKQERRQKEREKRKRKMEERRMDPEKYPDTRTVSRKMLKDSKMSDSTCKVGVVFDLQFEDLMNQRDLGKTLKQIMKCYSMNRRLSNPLQLHITSFQGRVEQEMDKNQGYKNWDLHFHQERFDEEFPLDKIVYLSSESENVLSELDESKYYIIGGLVDHNQHKGVCHAKAIEMNLATARLPIDEFISLKTRKVLTVNHVYEILAAVTEGKGWKDAFLEIIPDRKGVAVKYISKEENSGGGDSTQDVGDEGRVAVGESIIEENDGSDNEKENIIVHCDESDLDNLGDR